MPKWFHITISVLLALLAIGISSLALKLGLIPVLGVSPFGYLCCRKTKSNVTIGKSTHYLGQPVYGQLI